MILHKQNTSNANLPVQCPMKKLKFGTEQAEDVNKCPSVRKKYVPWYILTSLLCILVKASCTV